MGIISSYLESNPKAVKRIRSAKDIIIRPCFVKNGFGIRIEDIKGVIGIADQVEEITDLQRTVEKEAVEIGKHYKKLVFRSTYNDLLANRMLRKLSPYIAKAMEDSMSGETVKSPLFSLEDLVGKTMCAAMRIKNPFPYEPETTSPNPDFFDSQIFSDSSYVLHMNMGWNDGTTLHSFFVEDDKVRYTNQLYSRY